MKLLSLLFVVFVAPMSFAQKAPANCPDQIIPWDSDGHSLYVNHEECAGKINAAPSGSSQIVEASTDFAGGVDYATFKCENGTWSIDSNFG